MTTRVHPFPSRTRKLSSLVPTILGWRRPGKIGQRLHSSLAQSVEHAAVNRRVVCSSQTGGAYSGKHLQFAGAFLYFVHNDISAVMSADEMYELAKFRAMEPILRRIVIISFFIRGSLLSLHVNDTVFRIWRFFLPLNAIPH